MNNHPDHINLVPREYAAWRYRRITVRRWVAAVGTLATGCALVIALNAESESTADMLQGRISQVQLQTQSQDSVEVQGFQQVKDSGSSLDQRATTPTEWGSLLAILGALAHERVYFRVVEVSRDSTMRMELFFEGMADATDRALAFAAAIEETGLFEPLEAPTVTPGVANGVQFDLSAGIASASPSVEDSP